MTGTMTETTTSELPIDLDASPAEEAPAGKGFSVRLDNFEGPFDLLLQLISKHKLDITEVALSQVTDDFIAHIKAMGSDWDLDQTSEFLLVAATLLDLKAARLLPQGDVEDAEDLALLEARDLLFARLLQYRAFKQIAALINGRMAEEARRFPRSVSIEPRFAALLPEVLIGIDPAGLAALAAAALAPKPVQELSLAHLHAPMVTVREQATVIVDRLRVHRSTSFRALVADSPDTVTTVCRFLALLELFREGAVAFDQVTPLGELSIRWTGSDAGEIEVGDEFDLPPGADSSSEPDSDSDSDVEGDFDGLSEVYGPSDIDESFDVFESGGADDGAGPVEPLDSDEPPAAEDHSEAEAGPEQMETP
jgi:segregation and condensation protein A